MESMMRTLTGFGQLDKFDPSLSLLTPCRGQELLQFFRLRRGVVGKAHFGRAVSAHLRQSLHGSCQRLADRLGQCLDGTGRNQPAIHARLDKFRDAGDVCRDHRTAKRQRFHQDDGQPLGETRQYHDPSIQQVLPHGGAAQPTRDVDSILQSQTPRLGFDLCSQGAIAGENGMKQHAFSGLPSERIQ